MMKLNKNDWVIIDWITCKKENFMAIYLESVFKRKKMIGCKVIVRHWRDSATRGSYYETSEEFPTRSKALQAKKEVEAILFGEDDESK